MEISKNLKLITFYVILNLVTFQINAQQGSAEESTVPKSDSPVTPPLVLSSESGKSRFKLSGEKNNQNIHFEILLRKDKYFELKDIGALIRAELIKERNLLLSVCQENSGISHLSFEATGTSPRLKKTDMSVTFAPAKVEDSGDSAGNSSKFKLSEGALIKVTEHYISNETVGAELINLDGHLEVSVHIKFEKGYKASLDTKAIVSCD